MYELPHVPGTTTKSGENKKCQTDTKLGGTTLVTRVSTSTAFKVASERVLNTNSRLASYLGHLSSEV